jgi:hypothetical protein
MALIDHQAGSPDRLAIILIVLAAASSGCERSDGSDRSSRELKTVVAPGGGATAHFIGKAPTSEPGELLVPLEYGVEALYFTFPNDARRYAFKPEGELFFSDWHFGVFSSDGKLTALLQSHYGPITVVPTSALRDFLDGKKMTSSETVRPPPIESGNARVIDDWRWIGPDELEFRAACCGTSELVRHRVGDARASR